MHLQIKLMTPYPLNLGFYPTLDISICHQTNCQANYHQSKLPTGSSIWTSLIIFLTGPIPKELEQLKNLDYLGLNDNYLNGTIPTTLACLSQLQYLNLSHNNLSGDVPCSVYSIIGLHDLSYNPLNRQIPQYGYDCPPDNCPPPSQDPSQKRIAMLTLLISLLVIVFLSLLAFACFRCRKTHKKETKERAMKNGDICSIWNYDGRIAYEDIIKATNDFDIRYCIGTGGYGSVYKAQLPSIELNCRVAK
ncbi:unnamed protein product [Camellia sinensis]